MVVASCAAAPVPVPDVVQLTLVLAALAAYDNFRSNVVASRWRLMDPHGQQISMQATLSINHHGPAEHD